MNKIDVFINKSGGSVLRLGEEKVSALLKEALGDRIGDLAFIESGDLTNTLDKIANKNPLLIGGGDGTAVCAAQILGPRGIPFGVLPLGTMNLLAQDLGSHPTFEQTLSAFDDVKVDRIDVGIVNGKMFLCSAVIGFVPESAVAREELREETSLAALTKFLSTIKRGMSGDMKETLYLQGKDTDEPFPLETTALIVSNNRFVQNGADPAAGRFLRESLKDGKLAVYSAAPQSVLDGLKIAFSMWQGNWQDNESILSFEAEELIVSTQDRKILISLDGEPVEIKSPLRFSVQRQSIPVLRLNMRVT